MDTQTLLENLDVQIQRELGQDAETAQQAIQTITRHLWLSDIISFIRQEAVTCGYHEAIADIDKAGDTLSRLEEKRRDSLKQKGQAQRIVEELASEVGLAELAELLATEAEKRGCIEGARALEIASSNLP